MPTKIEIIEAGARAIAPERWRRIEREPLGNVDPDTWREALEKAIRESREPILTSAEAALEAMLPLIKQALAEEVRANSPTFTTAEGVKATLFEAAALLIENFTLETSHPEKPDS